MQIESHLAEADGKTTVRLGPDNEWRELDLGNESQCKAFYNFIVGDIKRYFTEAPTQQILLKKRFGFVPTV